MDKLKKIPTDQLVQERPESAMQIWISLDSWQRMEHRHSKLDKSQLE